MKLRTINGERVLVQPMLVSKNNLKELKMIKIMNNFSNLNQVLEFLLKKK